jgi:hypothetical protein
VLCGPGPSEGLGNGELGDGDVHFVAESMAGLEVVVGAVLELDPHEVMASGGPRQISKTRAEA